MEMKKYKLEDICLKITDGSHFSPKPAEHGYPMFSVKDMGEFGFSYSDAKLISKEDFEKMKSSGCVPQKNDVLVAKDGSYLKESFVCTEGKDEAILSSIAIFRPNTTIVDPYFLAYLFKTPSVYKYVKNGCVSGTALPRIVLKAFKQIELYLPQVEKQKKISSVLLTIDAKIALNRRMNTKLEQMAKRLYEHWFVQFDFPNADGKPYKASGGKMVWNEVLKRKIPEVWEVKRLEDVCNFRNGINYDKNVFGDKNYKIVNVRNITATTFFLNQNDFDEICLQSKIADNYLIPEISILIARSGSPGATRVIMNVKNNVIFCGFIICMEKFTPKYKFYFTYFLKKLENTSATKTGGSILQNVSQDTLKRLSVILPSEEIVDVFNEKILPIFNYQLTIQKEIQKLTNLRDRLLPLLMNGQVEVK